jgi:branched-chain amino acid transport system permease protein
LGGHESREILSSRHERTDISAEQRNIRMNGAAKSAAVEQLMRARRLHLGEALPWLVALGVYFGLPDYLQLGTQILSMILFAMSLDLLLGYTGIVTLGHAAYYGAGAYTAGLLAANGWTEALSGLLAATLVAGVLGVITGAVILRTKGLTLLMLGMAITLLLGETANNLNDITGGADGLQGITIAPVLGLFHFDMYGRATYLYALAVLFLVWLLMRQIVHAPFGRSLVGIRQNPARMQAIGVSVWHRKLVAYGISTALAGLAGGLSAQTNQFVSLDVLSFDLSGTVVLTLVLGGPGRLYGAFVGATILMVAQDALSKDSPVFWTFWLGLFVIGLVLFVRGGALGVLDAARARLRRAPRLRHAP